MQTATRSRPRPCPRAPTAFPATVLITGCNTGLGWELARLTLASGARLIVTCRTRAKVDSTIEALGRINPGADLAGYVLELSDARSVDALVDALAGDGVVLDDVILNAGVHVPFVRDTAPDGHELHHRVNFLSQARLFLRLANAEVPPGRVVYVSSNAHQRGELPAVFPLSFWARYARSKLLATTFFLAARPLYPSITISVISPGNVETDVHRHKHPAVRAFRRITGRAQSSREAAVDLYDGAFRSHDPEAYRNRGQVTEASPRCSDPELQLAVWSEATDELPALHGSIGARELVTNHAATLVRLAPPVRTPTSEEEIGEIVREARDAGSRLRVVGARHSYNDCFYSNARLVTLEHFDDIGLLDERRGTIRVGAGVTIQSLCDHLDGRGYALRWAGNSGKQTVVGAAMTGTHGYCRAGGLLAELIVGMRLVTGTGEVRSIVHEGDLRALRVSLGTLGIVTEVTLSVVPRGIPIQYTVETVDEADFLARLPRYGRENEYFRFFPNRYRRDRYSVLTINPTKKSVRPGSVERIRYLDETRPPRALVAAVRRLLRSRAMHVVVGRLPAPRLGMSLVAPFSTLLFVNGGIVDRWHRTVGLVYRAWDDDRTRNMELAIRPEDYPTFLRVLRSVQAESSSKFGPDKVYFTGRYVGASSKTLLGPNVDGAVVFLDVHVPRSNGARAFLARLERALQRVVRVRPHWGKEFVGQGNELSGVYPADAWASFRAAKNRYDPDNVFSNAYTERVFGW